MIFQDLKHHWILFWILIFFYWELSFHWRFSWKWRIKSGYASLKSFFTFFEKFGREDVFVVRNQLKIWGYIDKDVKSTGWGLLFSTVAEKAGNMTLNFENERTTQMRYSLICKNRPENTHGYAFFSLAFLSALTLGTEGDLPGIATWRAFTTPGTGALITGPP